MLQDGEVDIIFAGSTIDGPGIEAMTMERTEMVLVVAPGHPLAASRHPLMDLNGYRHLEHERGTATHDLVAAHLLREHGREAEGVELEEGALVPALKAGLGFAVMPRSLVDGDVAAGRLTVLPAPAHPFCRPSPPPAARACTLPPWSCSGSTCARSPSRPEPARALPRPANGGRSSRHADCSTWPWPAPFSRPSWSSGRWWLSEP